MIYTDNVRKELDAILKALTEREETECRRRIAAILRTIGNGADEYLDYLDSYLKDYQECYHGNAE